MPVRIVTPAGVLHEVDDAALVRAPAEGGDLGVEPGHMNLVAALRIGELRLVETGRGEGRPFAVHGGFLQASPEAVLVLADAAEAADDIDTARAEAARRRAEERLRTRPSGTDVARAEAALKRALCRLRVAGERG
jgi:F-type H+-transporting ATPase subunit epsilon